MMCKHGQGGDRDDGDKSWRLRVFWGLPREPWSRHLRPLKALLASPKTPESAVSHACSCTGKSAAYMVVGGLHSKLRRIYTQNSDRSTLKTPTDLHSKLRRMVSRLRRGACNRLVRRQRQRVERHKQLAVGACTQHGHVTNKHAYQTRACRDRHIALASTTQRGMAPSSTAHHESIIIYVT